VVSDDETPDARIRANVVLSQDRAHAAYGGVVPEIAAREHLRHLDGLIARAMNEAGVAFGDLDGIAATAGPGLIGGVIVGVMTAKAIAAVHDLPFLAVNHLEGHALTARLTDDVAFPYLLLIVSGGHCQLLLTKGVGRYRRLGTTIDDALGEAFDKTAKLLKLGYPGGPAVEAAARTGDPSRFDLPRPMKGREGCHFSFSGLKTAVRHAIAALPDGLDETARADMCASFQEAAADAIADRCRNAIAMARDDGVAVRDFVVAGGVAANSALRARLASLAASEKINLIVPPPRLCTDNAAMIAWAGLERLRLGLTDELDFAPRPRWPLDPDAPAVAFAGVKA
jgi:N6-L-threonylcarbamoyladenine synthase